MKKLKVLDLFSGIGGFSLGLERTGGFETVAFCEIAKFPQKVLKKHWPNVKIFNDVRNIEYDGHVDVITGGFPCQDLSIGGNEKGLEGARSGLWTEIIKLTVRFRPRYVIVENVANLLAGPDERSGGWFSRVLGDLAKIGYDAEWHCIPACAINAPHTRDRVWIISYPAGIGQPPCGQYLWEYIEKFKSDTASSESEGWGRMVESRIQRVAYGLPDQLDRLKGCGNSIVPHIAEIIGHAILQTLPKE